jgi:holin-like protein
VPNNSTRSLISAIDACSNNIEEVAMLTAILSLTGCQLAGELVREIFDLPIPGPVIGLFLLAAVLARLSARSEDGAIPVALEDTGETLIANMGILFVPAGVGIITEADLLREEWLPVIAALIGSTVLSVAVTGLVMHWVTRPSERHPPDGTAACSHGDS